MSDSTQLKSIYCVRHTARCLKHIIAVKNHGLFGYSYYYLHFQMRTQNLKAVKLTQPLVVMSGSESGLLTLDPVSIRVVLGSGPQNMCPDSCISITRTLVRNADSQAPPKSTESATLRPRPSNLCFNKPFGWSRYSLKFEPSAHLS